jgi:hypothetical protein
MSAHAASGGGGGGSGGGGGGGGSGGASPVVEVNVNAERAAKKMARAKRKGRPGETLLLAQLAHTQIARRWPSCHSCTCRHEHALFANVHSCSPRAVTSPFARVCAYISL